MTLTARPVQSAFIRLDGQNNWQQSVNSARIYGDRALSGLRLGDEHATAILPTEPGGTFGGVTRPTGLAVGPDGRLFLADPGGNRILTYTTHMAAFAPLWPARETTPPDAYTLSQPRGVAMSRDGDLVVADSGNGRVIVYTWPGLAPRRISDLEGGQPWDLAYDVDGHLYVADPAQRRVHRFDRLWRRDAAYEGGAGALIKPKHLAFDSTGLLFVVDEQLEHVIALDERGRTLPPDDLNLYSRTFAPPLFLDEEGVWLPQDERPRCPALLLKGVEVDQRGRLKGAGLMLLARPAGVTYPRQGIYVSEALDSELYDCAWHRLVLDVDIPEGANLIVYTFTAPTELEPARIAALPDDRWSTGLVIEPQDWPEILIQSGRGRYLWVKIELNSNGRVTPVIRSMTLYAPRASSLSYLPPVFQEDAVSADFLDRYLSYFDTIFDEIESQIERFTGYLDPDGVPAGEFLTWLGSWLDLKFLAEWHDSTRREFIRRAIELYKLRGTLAGMQEILRLHTGLKPPQPIIVEHFRLRDYTARHQAGGLVDGKPYLAGWPFVPADKEIAHHFTVILPDQAAPDEDALQTMRRLIDAQKPAHTHYEIRVVHPGLRIGCQSTIGVDALIGPYPSAALGELKLAQSGQLAPSRPRLGYKVDGRR
jgi:phage tail-like protein